MTLSEYLLSLKGKKIAVLGYGISNRPLVKLLAGAGLDVTVRDKGILPEIPGVKRISGESYLDELTEDVVFRTPGLRPDRIPLKAGAVLTSEMEAFFALCPCPILAVTGSDGKTTTTTLISELLKASGKKVWLGGNIGHPLLAEVEAIDHAGILSRFARYLKYLPDEEQIASGELTKADTARMGWLTELYGSLSDYQRGLLTLEQLSFEQNSPFFSEIFGIEPVFKQKRLM